MAAVGVTHLDSQEGYHIQGRIGQGAFASVYSAYCTSQDTVVAIKVIELEAEGSFDDVNYVFEKVRNESTTMLQLRHENIVSSLACFIFEAEVWIVMPMLVVSVADVLKQSFPTGFDDEKVVARILSDCVTGLEYLHRQNLIHRDIKCGNVLLTHKGVSQIADFGVSGSLVKELEKDKRLTVTGTPCWMAPEVAENTNPHDAKADIWSLGITALELINGKPPYSNLTAVNAMMKILTDVAPSVDKFVKKSYTKQFKNFIDACLNKVPKKRKTAKELKSQSLFNNLMTHKEVAELLGISDGKNPYAKEISKKCFPNSLENKNKRAPASTASTPFIFTQDNKEAMLAEVAKAAEKKGQEVEVNQFVEVYDSETNEWTLGIVQEKQDSGFKVLIDESIVVTVRGNNIRGVWLQSEIYEPCLEDLEKFSLKPEELRSYLLHVGLSSKYVREVRENKGESENLRDSIDNLISKVVVWRVRSKQQIANVAPKQRGRFTEIDEKGTG